jgi:hypothetical protein
MAAAKYGINRYSQEYSSLADLQRYPAMKCWQTVEAKAGLTRLSGIGIV